MWHVACRTAAVNHEMIAMARRSWLTTVLRLFVAAALAATLTCGKESPRRPLAGPSRAVDTSAQPAKPTKKRMSEAGLAKIREHEAFIAKPYDDGAGNTTIGYGHMVLAGEHFPSSITEAEAIELFNRDVERVVNGSLDKIEVELTQNQIDAIGSFIFNVGPGAFEQGLLPYINARQHEYATRRILRYVTGRNARTGERRVLRGLQKRRRDEVALYKNPVPLQYLRREVTRQASRLIHMLRSREVRT